MEQKLMRIFERYAAFGAGRYEFHLRTLYADNNVAFGATIVSLLHFT